MRFTIFQFSGVLLAGFWGVSDFFALSAFGQPEINLVEMTPGNELRIQVTGTAGLDYRIQVTEDFSEWRNLATRHSIRGGISYQDSGAPFIPQRYYRIVELNESAVLTGDHLATDEGDVIIHPINHATFIMLWNEVMIYVDPVGGAGVFSGFPPPDLIFVTHAHGDHFNSATLTGVATDSTQLFVPQIVYNQLSTALRAQTEVMANGDTSEAAGVQVEAVPAYNITPGRLDNHPEGVGNGYVLTLGGRRLYFSGDTEDVPQMRALQNIDVAFICMNLPFTMTATQAADAVREFQPKVAYPYHYRENNQFENAAEFKELVGTDLPIEVRLRDWY